MDWKDIKPLTETEAINIVSRYFLKHGYDTQRINPNFISEGKKSPDIVGTREKEKVFLCEVKTPSHIFNQEMGMYMWNTAFNKLRNRIHKATKQFTDFDEDHAIPRIVAFTSNHPQLNWTHLQHNILGAVKLGDSILQDFSDRKFVMDTKNDLKVIDIFLWFQVNYIDRNSIVELAIYQNVDSHLCDSIEKLASGLSPKVGENIQAPHYSGLQ